MRSPAQKKRGAQVMSAAPPLLPLLLLMSMAGKNPNTTTSLCTGLHRLTELTGAFGTARLINTYRFLFHERKNNGGGEGDTTSNIFIDE